MDNKNKLLFKTTSWDKILIFLVVSISIIIFILIHYSSSKENYNYILVIKKDNITEKYNLSKDRILTISTKNGNMKIEIKNKKVRVIESNCPKNICVHTGWIKNVYESIICAPNKILITLEKDNGVPDYDSITY